MFAFRTNNASVALEVQGGVSQRYTQITYSISRQKTKRVCMYEYVSTSGSRGGGGGGGAHPT